MAYSGAAPKSAAQGLDLGALRGWFANSLILAGFPILFAFFLLPMVGGHEDLPNVIWPSAAVILCSLLLLGSRALTITAFDYMFLTWTMLAIGSHLYARAVLDRSLVPNELYANLGFILAVMLLYRAVFCLILINPPFATRVFVVSMVGAILLAVVLGLLQRYGPFVEAATKFAENLAPRKEKVLEGATNGRPTSVFGGPNLLGFADTVLTSFVLGWGVTNIRNINPLKVLAVMSLFGMAAVSSIASQSRSTLLLMLVFPVVFGVQLRRRAADQVNTVVFAAIFAIGFLGSMYMIETGRFDYLNSVEHTGVKHDVSYMVRVQALSQVARISPDIALLGSGTSQSNNPHMDYSLGYDRYSTIGVDNEWANSFEAFGVWGPLWLVMLYALWVGHAARLRGDPRFDARLIFHISICMLVLVIVLSPGAVRILKYETAGYSFSVLGALAAWRLLARPVGPAPPAAEAAA